MRERVCAGRGELIGEALGGEGGGVGDPDVLSRGLVRPSDLGEQGALAGPGLPFDDDELTVRAREVSAAMLLTGHGAVPRVEFLVQAIRVTLDEPGRDGVAVCGGEPVGHRGGRLLAGAVHGVVSVPSARVSSRGLSDPG